MILRSQFGYDVDQASLEAGLSCPEPTLAQQHQEEEANINTIVRRFGITGQVPVSVMRPIIEDFVEATDYQSALNAIMAAQKSFMAMPADVRSRFNNDPHMFVDFCSDEANLDEMRKLGLAVPKTADAVVVGASGATPGAPGTGA